MSFLKGDLEEILEPLQLYLEVGELCRILAIVFSNLELKLPLGYEE